MPVETLATETDELRKVWYCSHGEQCLGPFNQEGLKQGLQCGEFSKDDLFWREGQPGWTPLKEIPELSPLHDIVRLPSHQMPVSSHPGEKLGSRLGAAPRSVAATKANLKHVTRGQTASSVSKSNRNSSIIDLFLALLAGGGLSSPFWQKGTVDVEAKAKELYVVKQSQVTPQAAQDKAIDLLTLTSSAFPKPDVNFWELSCDKKSIRKVAGEKKKTISIDDNSENLLKSRFVSLFMAGVADQGARKNASWSDLTLGTSLNSCPDRKSCFRSFGLQHQGKALFRVDCIKNKVRYVQRIYDETLITDVNELKSKFGDPVPLTQSMNKNQGRKKPTTPQNKLDAFRYFEGVVLVDTGLSADKGTVHYVHKEYLSLVRTEYGMQTR